MTTVAGTVNSFGVGSGIAISSITVSAILIGARRPRRARYASIAGDGARGKIFIFIFYGNKSEEIIFSATAQGWSRGYCGDAAMHGFCDRFSLEEKYTISKKKFISLTDQSVRKPSIEFPPALVIRRVRFQIPQRSQLFSSILNVILPRSQTNECTKFYSNLSLSIHI